MTDQPTPEIEPDDTCRPVEVDGEIIRVRGAREMTDKERGYLAEVIQAAKRKYEAEHPEPSDPAQTTCIHPDGYDGECPCPPSCGCCKVAPAAEPLRARIAEAIEDAIYEHRERACQWGETDGTTQEIARRATNAVMAVVDPSPPPLNLPRETVATLHDMLGQLLASNPATSSDTMDNPLREEYAALFRHPPGAERLGDATPGEIAAAVLAVRDREHAALKRAHVALAAQAGRDQAAIDRVRSECDRIEAAVRANPQDPDFDGAYLAAIGHIRAALQPPASDGAPTVAEAAADDERWPLEKAGE